MNCERFDQLLDASSFRPLEGAEPAEFDEHLVSCPRCVDHLRGHLLTTGLLKGMKAHEDAEVAPPLRADLVARILAACAAEARRREETA